VARIMIEIDQELFDAIQGVARDRVRSWKDIFRSMIKLGLLAASIEEDPNRFLAIVEGEPREDDVVVVL